MEKKYTITLRLTDMQYTLLGAICRRTKRNQSEVIRSFIENGSVRERISQEHIYIIRQLIGESTNLNQLARQANTYGFSAVAKRCEEMAERIASSSNFNCADYCDSFSYGCAFNCGKKGREIALKWLQSEAE